MNRIMLFSLICIAFILSFGCLGAVKTAKKAVKLSEKLVQEAKKEVEAENNQPVPTAMEMAIRSAMERSQQDEAEENNPGKKENSSNEELEDIFSRTLERKVKTAAE